MTIGPILPGETVGDTIDTDYIIIASLPDATIGAGMDDESTYDALLLLSETAPYYHLAERHTDFGTLHFVGSFDNIVPAAATYQELYGPWGG